MEDKTEARQGTTRDDLVKWQMGFQSRKSGSWVSITSFLKKIKYACALHTSLCLVANIIYINLHEEEKTLYWIHNYENASFLIIRILHFILKVPLCVLEFGLAFPPSANSYVSKSMAEKRNVFWI